ncbi:zinc-dependent metalloprotease [Portibacter marinus]|uniref:zinc-dependent metalloprotease n=1 Tax=Portibacter marinus TaxID=2898660 RepID=UPI001F29C25E|nr:zinc-dependent metalloprotease [Portibacter marinus]
MKPVITGIVLMALCISRIGYAQNDTPMEVLTNIAHENSRFIPFKVFTEEEREDSHLETFLSEHVSLRLDREELKKILDESPETVFLNLPFKHDQALKIKIVNHDIRAEGFEIIDLQKKRALPIPRAEFYRGTISNENDGLAGISFFEDEVYAIFSSKRYGNIVLTKDPIQPGDGDRYILYADEDLLTTRDVACETDAFKPISDYQETITRSNVYETCDDVEVYVEATYKLYNSKGGAASTSNFISAFFNNSAIIYRNEGIYTSLKKIAINTSEDGYSNLTTSFDNLNRFGEMTKNKYQQYGAELAHLVDHNETSLGGVAWINAMCSNYYYFSSQDYHHGAYAYSSVSTSQSNFPDYSLTVFMFTHEMGHNLGSKHTQWCGWDGGPIDDCASVEGGTCSPGPTPTNGGTIMSYCHSQQGIGINFNNGFADQPGNLIRAKVASKTCVEPYVANSTVAATPVLTITANRECTDEEGWTSYYDDKNTSDESDDQLILAVKKNGENIGNLDDGSLIVRLKTSSNAGNGSTHIDNPGYSASSDWHVMNRWFELIPTNEPNNPVSVRFPYTNSDFMDVTMNQPSVTSHNDLIFYKIDSPSDPNPDHGHTSVGNNDITFYMNGTTASLDTWRYLKNGSIHLAEFQVSSFSGGGGGFTENGQPALPVELLNYKLEHIEGHVKHSWTTGIEVNNESFTIERSRDGINFEKIGKISGAGTSYESIDYEFIDRNPHEGLNYFRLSQTDFDGIHVTLSVRALELPNSRAVEIYPNPLTNTNILYLNYFTRSKTHIRVMIKNIEGKVFFDQYYSMSKGENTLKTRLNVLKPGMYIVQIVDGQTIYTKKLIKD